MERAHPPFGSRLEGWPLVGLSALGLLGMIFALAYVVGAVESPERLPLGVAVLGALAVRLLGKQRTPPAHHRRT